MARKKPMDVSVGMLAAHGVGAAVHVAVVSRKPITAHDFGKAVCAPDISRLACLLCISRLVCLLCLP